MTPSDLTRLDAQLQRLQLHHIQSHYQALATKAAEQHSSHLDYLEQLVEGEATMRENRSIERRITALNREIEAKSKRLKNPHPSDSLAWAAWIIGRLGGWDGYPSSKPPGPITMKHGLEYFHAVAVGWSLKNVCMP